MPRRTKKEPAVKDEQALQTPTNNDTADGSTSQVDESETQIFQEDETSYKPPTNQNKARHFCAIAYPESAPHDWKEQLQATGLTWACSPLHEHDVNPDGSPKKPHYHIIVSYGNTTTYNAASSSIRAITHGPYPLICHSVSGSYAYFTHKHNPEKYQYNETDIERFNGWTKVLESTEVRQLKDELVMMIITQDCTEYAEFIIEAKYSGNPDAYEVAMNNTVFFNQFITSYRHRPERVLMRLFNLTTDNPQLQDIIRERLLALSAQTRKDNTDNESDND